ncbi:kinesin light chain 1 protein [Diplodia corticola]|uniref:Kinesin light chain 1 protein n=1 Tax=Diplodia corticola TaxID=236234 RepID=A0A1J9S0J4_9PEZI|nr:kinesin light chain 1 protein [Diplodia corticola]OJD34095.1 kinesin light chain 1 protein [Diplodia corticola]
MASTSQSFGDVTAGDRNSILQGNFYQSAPLTSALKRKRFRHGNYPPPNRNFLGREAEVAEIKAAFRGATAGEQKRYVIYGLAGIGKSEICVKLLKDMQNEFWGLFWVDVSDFVSAEQEFKKIADQIRPGNTHQTLGDALSALAELDFNTYPWLLVLDNADELRDYAPFFPSASSGSILMTSRNRECEKHETIGSRELEPISFEDSMLLLFKAAKLPPKDWDSYRPQAKTIVELLDFHTLALIQAGAFVSRDARNWNEYPRFFKDNRQHLLTTSPKQARSKYGDVYATFEVSARALKSDGGTEAEDALCLLGIFAMFHHSGFPTSIFEDALRGIRHMKITGFSNDTGRISTSLADLLPAFLSESRGLTLRLQAGLDCLEALSLIKQATIDNGDGVKLVSMHPLAHAWAKDRLDQKLQEQAWMMTGSIIAFSMKSVPQSYYYRDSSNWRLRTRQLQSHISSFLDNRVTCSFRDPWGVEYLQVNRVIAYLLHIFRLDQKLELFLLAIFETLEAEPSRPEDINLLPFYKEMARNWGDLNRYPSSLDLWRRIVSLQEANSFHEEDLVSSKNNLACTYASSGAFKEAIAQLESIVQLRKRKHSADDPGLLKSQHDLGGAYLDDGQVEKAINLLEHVVHIRQSILAENSPVLLASQHELGRAYTTANRLQEALKQFEYVAKIKKTTLPLGNPNRIATLTWLPRLYLANGQLEKAKEVVIEVDGVLRSLPKDDARWRKHGEFLEYWKRSFEMEDKL